MAYSMTGYGKGIAETGDKKIVIEVKAVNHRFLDLSLKIPKNMQFTDEIIRRVIKERVLRGHIDLFLTYEDNSSSINLSLNVEAAKAYHSMALKLIELGFKDNLGAAEALLNPELINKTINDTDDESFSAITETACIIAIEQLNKMRKTEGTKLTSDLLKKISDLEEGVNRINTATPNIETEYRKRLTERITEAVGGVIAIDEARIINEVAFLVDKVNIDEEITRLRCHITEFKGIINDDGNQIGRRLDFLTQELHREVNTVGSKTNDINITKEVLSLKNIIEMMREQVQNLE